MHTLKALVLLTIVNLVGCTGMYPTPPAPQPGRYQIVNTAPHPMLLDTATGITWVLCEEASSGSVEWCITRFTQDGALSKK